MIKMFGILAGGALLASTVAIAQSAVQSAPDSSASALGKDVALDQRVDPALLGGLVVKVGSRMIDTSLRTRLNSLKVAMKEVG